MTMFAPLFDTSTQITLQNQDALYVAPDISISVPNAVAVLTSTVIPFASFSVVCEGTITGAGGIYVGTQCYVSLSTTGRILGASYGILLDGIDNRIDNDGLIFSSSVAIGTGLLNSGSLSTLNNTGVIKAASGTQFVNGAVVISQIAPISVLNSGTIESVKSGGAAYLSLRTSIDTVINTGTMTGKVSLGAGADFFDTSGGRITGLISGDAGSDTIIGSAFADRIKGGTDSDTIIGGAGSDVINGGQGADSIDGGAGADTVTYDSSVVTLTINLATGRGIGGDAQDDVLTGVENVTTLNGSQILNGSSSANALSAGADNDTLNGGLGRDTLTGGSGADAFVFNTALSASSNLDRITDFSSPPDQIHLENAIFKGLTAGALSSAKFWKSATGVAHDGDDRIIYNTTTGVLSYDSNGDKAGGAVAFAILANKANITAADFLVI